MGRSFPLLMEETENHRDRHLVLLMEGTSRLMVQPQTELPPPPVDKQGPNWIVSEFCLDRCFHGAVSNMISKLLHV